MRDDRLPLAEEYTPEAREPGGFVCDDAALTRRLQGALHAEEGFEAGGLRCVVQAGCVTLSGRVSDAAAMQRFEAVACAVPGVSAVVNRMSCPGPADPGATRATPVPGAAGRMGKPDFDR